MIINGHLLTCFNLSRNNRMNMILRTWTGTTVLYSIVPQFRIILGLRPIFLGKTVHKKLQHTKNAFISVLEEAPKKYEITSSNGRYEPQKIGVCKALTLCLFRPSMSHPSRFCIETCVQFLQVSPDNAVIIFMHPN